MFVPVCKYPGRLVKLISGVIIIYKSNVQNGTVANPSVRIAIAFHQTVVGIRLLFFFIISQAELEIHHLQKWGNRQYKTTPAVYYKTKIALIRKLYDFELYPPTEYGLKKILKN